jgi:hypothetical protein
VNSHKRGREQPRTAVDPTGAKSYRKSNTVCELAGVRSSSRNAADVSTFNSYVADWVREDYIRHRILKGKRCFEAGTVDIAVVEEYLAGGESG